MVTGAANETEGDNVGAKLVVGDAKPALVSQPRKPVSALDSAGSNKSMDLLLLRHSRKSTSESDGCVLTESRQNISLYPAKDQQQQQVVVAPSNNKSKCSDNNHNRPGRAHSCGANSSSLIIKSALSSALHRIPFASSNKQCRRDSTKPLETCQSRRVSSPEELEYHRRPLGSKKNSSNLKRAIYRKFLSSKLARNVNRFFQMAPRRYYILLFCSTLLIVACLLASLAISRSVSELGGQDNEPAVPSNRVGQSLRLSGDSDGLGNAPHALELLERRSIDLVDLIECGKTFAYVKLRAQVQVPKSTPIYRQQPSFLHPNTAESRRVVEQQPARLRRNSKLVLKEANIGAEVEADEPRAADADATQTAAALTQPIKPIPRNQSANVIEASDFAAMLASVGGGSLATAESSLLSDGASAGHHDDPLQAAADDLNLTLSAINSTIVDCFIVDTEKRYNQKMALEDRHRLVASTRKVDFKRMMATIVGCRRLTWATLPDPAISKRQQPASPQPPPVDLIKPVEVLPSAPQGQDQSQPATNDFLGSILSGLFDPPQPETSTSKTQPLVGAESEQVPVTPAPTRQQLSNRVAQRLAVHEDPRHAQGSSSYLNMGMSMVSGIVPNTLWCGLGDRAANYSELGAEHRVDSCCRAHDHCPIRLKPFTTDYGIVNWSMSTRSHCDCDLDFNDCLTAANSTLSSVIRLLYFRFVGLQCIDTEPVVEATSEADS